MLLVGKIQFDCASGINPCGFNLPLLTSLTKSATTDLSMLEAALSEHATLDVNELYLNKEITAYLEENPVDGTEWGLYPNPASDVVNIQVFNELPASTRIRMYDMQGRLVPDKVYSEDLVELNVKAIKSGVYKIVLNDDFKGSKSLIISR
ncbi:MAG: T9SS type A sorting domain-containing protein [Draconibacterium sp.]